MPESDNPGLSDDEALASHAAVLAGGVEQALPGWVVRCVVDTAEAWRPGSSSDLLAAAEAAGIRARAEVGPRVRALLAEDVDRQASGPLAILRSAVVYPTEVLAAAGVDPVERDPFALEAFPDDVYGLAPASFADLHPALQEPGIIWGAAKAHVVLARRRAEGQR